ncbi:UNVERIFIED_ORG: hypothetical protein OKW14_003915 [Pantoea brenneri]|nr:hypothetical protein [Pantoea brenneri]
MNASQQLDLIASLHEELIIAKGLIRKFAKSDAYQSQRLL